MELTAEQMRAIELMIEQQERLGYLAKIRRNAGVPMDITVREFYSVESVGGSFEMVILDKIGKLLTPESTEDLNLEIGF